MQFSISCTKEENGVAPLLFVLVRRLAHHIAKG
jgi:hypothetical protein